MDNLFESCSESHSLSIGPKKSGCCRSKNFDVFSGGSPVAYAKFSGRLLLFRRRYTGESAVSKIFKILEKFLKNFQKFQFFFALTNVPEYLETHSKTL